MTVMSWLRGSILILLVVWAVTGPIGMAFTECALACDEPCSLTTASITLPPAIVVVLSVVGTPPGTLEGRPVTTATVLDPPPRPSLLSA